MGQGSAARQGGTVREATVDLLRELGMTTVFGNPGSTEIPFLGEWPNSLRYVLGLQEASVVAMADGYARASGRAAFCNLHSAAGVGHALGNVFTAHRNNAPLVITAGQQARALLPHQPFLGATDAAQFPKPYVKWSAEPARAEDVPAAIAQAWRVATQRPRGPAFVSIPVDDWARPAGTLAPPRPALSDPAPDPAVLAELAAALAAARRPVLVIGPEVDEEGAGPAAVALAERLNAPAWASPFASRLCFPEDHRLFAGHLVAAPEAVADSLSGHDLVLVLGAPVFTFHVAGHCALFEGATPLWHLTTDAEAAARAPVGRGVLGSLRLGLPALLPCPAGSARKGGSAAARACARSGRGRSVARRLRAVADGGSLAAGRRRCGGSAFAPPGHARADAVPRVGVVLHHGERRARLRAAGRGRRRARAGGGGERRGGARRVPHRRRLADVLRAGAVDGGAAPVAALDRRAQQPRLWRDALLQPGDGHAWGAGDRAARAWISFPSPAAMAAPPSGWRKPPRWTRRWRACWHRTGRRSWMWRWTRRCRAFIARRGRKGDDGAVRASDGAGRGRGVAHGEARAGPGGVARAARAHGGAFPARRVGGLRGAAALGAAHHRVRPALRGRQSARRGRQSRRGGGGEVRAGRIHLAGRLARAAGGECVAVPVAALRPARLRPGFPADRDAEGGGGESVAPLARPWRS